MKRRLPTEGGHGAVALFFGYVGAFTALALAPLVAAAALLGRLAPAPVPRAALGLVAAEGLLDYVLADYLWARAVMLLGPTVASLGLSIQIPIAAVADTLVHGRRSIPPVAAWMARGGTAMILLGFAGINLASSPEDGGGSGGSGSEGGGGGGRRGSDGSSRGGTRRASSDLELPQARRGSRAS